MTRIVDTTVRLLSQQPLQGNASTATVLEVAEILDGAGFAGLEVSGGGCFDAAVRRGVESPWDRIRALKARCTRTPLQIAVRGRFLVGSRPVSDDLVRRFILSAAESGIDVFRLHDPLNDVENLAAAAAAVREAGGRLYAGLAFSGQMGNLERVIEKARRLADLGAERVLLHDSAGALDPGTAGSVVERLAAASGVPAGLYCQGTGGKALAMAVEAARHGAEPIAVAAYPVGVAPEPGVGRGPVRGARRPRARARRRCRPRLGRVPVHRRARHLAHAGPAGAAADHPAHRRSPACRWASSPTSTPVCAAADALDRLDEVLAELNHVRADCGTAPLAQPIGGILAGQAVSARADGAPLGRGVGRDARSALRRLRDAAAAVRPRGRSPRRRRCRPSPSPTWTTCARRPAGWGARRTCCCWPSSARTPPACSRACAGAAAARHSADAVDHSQSERVRELIRLLESSDEVSELTVEDGAVRITVRKQDERQLAAPVATAHPGPAPAAEPEVSSAIRLESPMVGTFYRSPSPAQPAFVDEGDRVEVGQTLCILEAMKLFNEYKSDHAGVIRRILVDNAEPVEYGQPLFELEPV